MIAYNLGVAKERPAMKRFNFGEKVEYWAVVWGTFLMAITGYVLWNPVAVSQILPGEFIPAAKAAHGFEAILAVLSILTWHVYHVHIKYFNRSIFTGNLSYHEMEEEHRAELERILAEEGERPEPPPDVVWKRTRLYLPVAGALAAVILIGTYWFFTLEQTAITTVPPQQIEEAYVPLTPIALPTATPQPAVAVQEAPTRLPLPTPEPAAITSHPAAETHQDCVACHDVYSMISPAPLDHAEYANDGCLECHQPTQEVAQQ